MPPRGTAKAEIHDDDIVDECARLRHLAREAQVCSKQRRTVAQDAQQLPQYLASADGKDIVKKSSTRKGRYLFHISADFQPAVGGRMGTLAKLDSKNPVLYIDFPSGRMKLIGTLMFPKTKYQLLRLGGKDVLCEDIFDSAVLFAEMQWIGSKEANPSEAPLEMPQELQTPIMRDSAANEAVANGGVQPARRQQSPASQPASQPATQPASQRSRGAPGPRSAQKRRREVLTLDDSSEDEVDAVEGTEPLSQRTHLGRSSKAAARKKLLEVDDEKEEEEDDDDGAASSDEAVANGGVQPARRQHSPASQPASQPATQPASQRSRGAPGPRSAQKRRREVLTLDDSSEDEVDAMEGTEPVSQRTHLGRSSKAAAQKKLLEVDDEEEEEEQDNDDGAASSGDIGSDSGGDA